MNATTVDGVERHAAVFRECFDHVRGEIEKVFVGQPDVVEQLLVCFFCQGHALIEGAPGLGKTRLVRALSEAVTLEFARVQCTPDLMPADITGTNILVEAPGGVREFVFERGPIFANVVLADEINRATPRTQSAFLEAMQERHVTIFGVTHGVPQPFCVFATQNPIEMEGTYPLPEAQLDRFFFKLTVRTPTVEDMVEIMARTTGGPQPAIAPRFGAEAVGSLLGLVKQVKITADITRLALRIVRATHPDAAESPDLVKKYVRYGASPRGAQAIVLAAKTFALIDGRYHVSADDVRRAVPPALNHRIILNFHGEMERIDRESLVARIIADAFQ